MDEITNKVYRDIIHGKSETTEHKPVSDKTSVKVLPLIGSTFKI